MAGQQTFQTAETLTPSPPARAPWPDAVAYREAVQQPSACFASPELRSAHLRTDRVGLPLAYTGRFAVVFRARLADGTDWALRCFTTEGSADVGGMARTTRWERLTTELAHLSVTTASAAFVPFRYDPAGIRVGATRYPLLTMRWAGGETLGRWVETHRHDPAALLRLCVSLGRLLESLEAAQIAHGDWQHDNLLVDSQGETIRLVDYDGLWSPRLADLTPGERGHPNYQHPRRTEKHYGPKLDRFACRVIQTGLCALTCDATLWDAFCDGENLLFRRADLEAPDEAPVFAAVRQVAYASPTVNHLLTELADACASPPESVPPPVSRDTVLAIARERGLNANALTAPVTAPQTTHSPSVRASRVTQPATTTEAVVTPPVAVSTSSQHRKWVRSTRKTMLRYRVRDLAHRAVMWAAYIWLFLFWCDNQDIWLLPLGLLGPLITAIGFYAWPRNQELLSAMEAAAKNEVRVDQVRQKLKPARERLAALNANPRSRSEIAFVGHALQQVTIASIAPHLKASPPEIEQVVHSRLQTLADVPSQGTEIPGVLPGISPQLVAFRRQHLEEAKRAYANISQHRKTLQYEITRLEQELRDLGELTTQIRTRMALSRYISFGWFIAHLFGIGP